ncbi:hypothetical protein LEMLEM_LOCUS22143 [Lemmus lemmus]
MPACALEAPPPHACALETLHHTPAHWKPSTTRLRTGNPPPHACALEALRCKHASGARSLTDD